MGRPARLEDMVKGLRCGVVGDKQLEFLEKFIVLE
jgi:hypothetical protein